jgi:hypothetical protein
MMVLKPRAAPLDRQELRRRHQHDLAAALIRNPNHVIRLDKKLPQTSQGNGV